MNLRELKKIEKLPHLSDFSVNQLITELSLYEPILITTRDVEFIPALYDGEAPFVRISKDVQTLHELCQSEKRILLPCPKCNEDRPFEQSKGWNPRKNYLNSSTTQSTKRAASTRSFGATSSDEGIERYNVFDPKPNRPHYHFGSDHLADVDQSEFQDYPWGDYINECGRKCRLGILDNFSELRKDFTCTLDSTHKGFVDFFIICAVPDEPSEMKLYWERQYAAQAENPDAVIEKTDEEQASESLYYKYCDSLLLVKVGQYPSLRDLQLFDTQKYRKILGKLYTDYTLALALYADGIGAGSFVYLRRIIEKFVEEVHLDCVKQCDEAVVAGTGNAFDEGAYEKKRFNEKISYLEQTHNKVIIPEELDDIRGIIYGVISKGVHESTEQECLQLFPSAKYIIDAFIEEKIRQKEKQERLAAVKNVFTERADKVV